MLFALTTARAVQFHLVHIVKEQRMKNLSNILLPAGLLCLLGACGIAGLSILAITASSVGFDLPFSYFQYLSLPALSVALPVVGILALAPFALRLAFASEASAEKTEVAKLEDLKSAAEAEHDEYYLKAA
jgi:hypothetical protein